LFEGLFYFHPGFGKGARCRCREDSRGHIRRGWAKLALRAGAGFTVPWKKGHTGFWLKHLLVCLDFLSLFRVHPGLRGDLPKLKGRPGSEEGYGATGT